MKVAFILDGRLTIDHRLAFKRLFKQAWHDRDHIVMGACIVRLDRSIRRRRAARHRFDDGVLETTEVLRMSLKDRRTIFSTATTHYLRRRAWRYFRRVGFREPAAYVPAIVDALARYTDEDVRLGQHLLDNWGLMHACFGKSDVLVFRPRRTNLRAQRRLAELHPAPMFERLWAEPNAAAPLLSLVLSAACRPVRVWAISVLKRHHTAALASVDASMLLRLIDHVDADVAAFAAELLDSAALVRSLPVPAWLRLLATRNPTVVAAVAEAFRTHVASDRVTLAQAVEIAGHLAAPVAHLGLEILQSRTVRSEEDRAAIASLAAARCPALGGEIAQWVMSIINVPGVYRLPQVLGFFDSRLGTMRSGAWAALDDASPAAVDPAFWSALLESPYDDVRTELVRQLERRQALPGADADALAVLWRNVLLNIHRGGRAKLTALKQISRQIVMDPDSAMVLVPVLAAAIRSVRPPEARHGLAAIVAAVEHMPELANRVGEYLPELRLDITGVHR